MSSKGWAIEIVFSDRFFRSLRFEKIYTIEPQNGKQLFELYADNIMFNNEDPAHSTIGDMTPMQHWILAK